MTRPDGTPWGDGTRVIQAGQQPRVGEPFLAGPVFAAPFHLPVSGPHGADEYGRHDNPTWRAYEAAVGGLEGGEAVLFSSGMAALTAVLLQAKPGETVLIPADGYFAGRSVGGYLAERGVTVRQHPTGRPMSDVDVEGAALVLVETPSNPGLDLCDLAAVAALAHRHGAALAVDNTTATPLAQRPLELGAAYSISSDTKALSGHSDVLLGHVAVTDPDRLAALRSWRTATGSIPGPFEVWLAHRGLATVDLRLARQAANALALATVLADHPLVTGLRYPGLPSDRGYQLARRQMRRFGGVLSFTLPSETAVATFLEASQLVHAATSFGGVHSTADRRAQWGGDAVEPGFVRLSAGCEDTADLVADVTGALAYVG